MEIKLNAGDKINIPENCTVALEDNLIIIEEKQEEFKEGDVLNIVYDNNKKCPFIYKGIDAKGHYLFYAGIDYCGDVLLPTNENARWGGDKRAKHATEEEKQYFFKELNAKGLRWNAENKTIMERAKKGEAYYFIGYSCDVVLTAEDGRPLDDERWNAGNYYLPSEIDQVVEDANAIRAIFEKNMFRRATSEETRRLYKQMKEEGLYWNFITKCVETIDTKTAYNSLWYETDPLWHKISDGDLPNKSGMFLVSIKGGHHQVIRYCHKDKLWATVFEQEDLEYWRENPSLPGK